DVRAVRRFRDARGVRHAGSGAPPDVVVEARPAGARMLIEEGVRAGSYGKDPGQRVEGLPDRPRVPVGPEVADVLPLGAPEHLRARPRLPHRQREVWVRLVVSISDV